MCLSGVMPTMEDEMSEEQQQDQHEQREADEQVPMTQMHGKGEPGNRDEAMERLVRQRDAERTKTSTLEKELEQLRTAQRDADEAKAKEEGQYKELLEQREAELANLKADLLKRDLRDTRAAMAREHNLPADAIEFVTGDDDAAIEASVKKLAKLFAKQDGPDTDSGKRSQSGAGAKRQESLLANYEFGKRR